MGAMGTLRAWTRDRVVLARPAWALCACSVLGLLGLLAPSAGAASTRSSPGAVRHAVVRRMLSAHARSHPRARAAIVGGSPISIAQAPWQVAVFVAVGEGALCGGSILSPTEILTAAHCAFGETSHVLEPEDFFVVAGTGDLAALEPGEQERLVSAVRAHPYYNPGEALPAADDVAVLTLASPLQEVAGDVQRIGPAAASAGPEEATGVQLTGFGQESVSPPELNGRLFAISMSTAFRRRCGGEADALFVCASTPVGSLCSGDSGSALTLPGTPATVAGVVNTVQIIEGLPCRNGAGGAFADVAAPEIRDFILGSETPPRAPRGGSAITIRGVLEVGRALTCEPGGWSNSPTITYAFIDSASGARLQSGPAQTYLLKGTDIGRAILCEVQAANEGGTGAVRTEALPPIGGTSPRLPILPESGPATGPAPQIATPGPPPPQTPPPAESSTGEASRISLQSTNLVVHGNDTATVKLACLGAGECTGRFSLSARHTIRIKGKRVVRTVAISPAVSFAIVEGSGEAVTIKLTSLGRSLLRAARGRLGARMTIAQVKPAPELRLTRSVELMQQLPHEKKS
jgi:hypothetical protein